MDVPPLLALPDELKLRIVCKSENLCNVALTCHDLHRIARDSVFSPVLKSGRVQAYLKHACKEELPLVEKVRAAACEGFSSLEGWEVPLPYALLFDALAGRSFEPVRGLLAAGADPNSRGPYGKTLLHLAAIGYWKGGKEILPLLLKRGGDPESVSTNGHTPLMELLYQMVPEYEAAPIVEMVYRGADILRGLKPRFQSKRKVSVYEIALRIDQLSYLVHGMGQCRAQIVKTAYLFRQHRQQLLHYLPRKRRPLLDCDFFYGPFPNLLVEGHLRRLPVGSFFAYIPDNRARDSFKSLPRRFGRKRKIYLVVKNGEEKLEYHFCSLKKKKIVYRSEKKSFPSLEALAGSFPELFKNPVPWYNCFLNTFNS